MDILNTTNIVYLGLALLGAFLIHSIYAHYRHLRKVHLYDIAPSLPGAPWWDPLGILLILYLQRAIDENRLLELVADIYSQIDAARGRRTTTIAMHALGRTDFLTIDPKNIQAVLALQFEDYGLGPDRIGSLVPMMGEGIFASDGKTWSHSRAMLRPNFTRARLEDVSLMERHCQDLFNALPAHGNSDGWTTEFDLQPFFYGLTMDSATEFFFGESCYSLRTTDRSGASPEARFVEAFDRCQYIVSQRVSLGSYYWLYDSFRFRRDCKIVHEWTDQCIARALERKSQLAEKPANLNEKDEKYILLHKLIEEETQDPINLRSQLLSVLVAGRDTTASLLSWVFHHLARHPEEYRKLRTAVLSTFGTFEHPRNITFASLRDSHAVQNILKETLRLHPSVPFNVRQALTDTTLPYGGGSEGQNPIFIAKNSQVFYSVHLMHRDPAIWGPTANEFVPDRWEGLRAGWEYLPFNGGPRICLGQMFALTSAGYCLVRMAQRFDALQTTDTRDVKINITLTAKSANGVHLSLHRAAS